jgi:hypothetical protein
MNAAPLSCTAVAFNRPTMRYGKSTENALEIGAALSFHSPNQWASLSSSPNDTVALGTVRTWQSLITPTTLNREAQTLGSAQKSILPELFPSQRDPLYAEPILHGAPVPLSAPLEEVMREAAYPDGWVHLSLRMM